MKSFKNQRGQSLIEYLIIVALVAVASFGMVKAVGTNVTIHFANIAKALGGQEASSIKPVSPQSSDVQTRNLGNYMSGATSGPSKN